MFQQRIGLPTRYHAQLSKRVGPRVSPGFRGKSSNSFKDTSQLKHHAISVESLQSVLAAAAQPHPGFLIAAGVNTVVFTAGFRVLQKGLTIEGIANAWLLGLLVYAAFGFGGYLLVCIYFLLGTLVTKVKLAEKQKAGIAEARSGRRGPASVWGSGIAAVVCAALALATSQFSVWQIGFVASIGSKLSDTVSSEIGKAYGRTTYLITTLQQVPRGTEGAVSLEGTLAGVAAAFGFCILATLLNQVTWIEAGVAGAACVFANIFESWLGATTQNKVEWLTNDLVNMIQISLAASLAVAAKQVLL